MRVARGTTLKLDGNSTGSGYLTFYCDGTNWTELTQAISNRSDTVAAVSAQTGRLTDAVFWDQWWQGYKLPAEVRKGERLLYDVLTGVIDRHIPRGSEITTLEIGGAPASGSRTSPRNTAIASNCSTSARPASGRLRRTSAGWTRSARGPRRHVRASRDRARRRGVLDRADRALRGPECRRGRSRQVLEARRRADPCLPQLPGPHRLVQAHVRARNYAIHMPENMDLRRWEQFERQLGLEPIEKRYIGGPEPTFFRHPERPPILRNVIALLSKLATVIFDRPAFRALWSTNRRWWDSYSLGIYRNAS